MKSFSGVFDVFGVGASWLVTGVTPTEGGADIMRYKGDGSLCARVHVVQPGTLSATYLLKCADFAGGAPKIGQIITPSPALTDADAKYIVNSIQVVTARGQGATLDIQAAGCGVACAPATSTMYGDGIPAVDADLLAQWDDVITVTTGEVQSVTRVQSGEVASVQDASGGSAARGVGGAVEVATITLTVCDDGATDTEPDIEPVDGWTLESLVPGAAAINAETVWTATLSRPLEIAV